MGKRSDFERVPRDFYPTPYQAVIPLIPHLKQPSYYVEPCAGEYDLIYHISVLTDDMVYCGHASDIQTDTGGFMFQMDAMELTEDDCYGADYIITNPPWDRKILHPMINHFRSLRPTWLLFDADWAFTKQSKEFMPYCSDIVAVGRVKWIPDSKSTGKDNCAWYQFQKDKVETKFHGR